jgi:hypothetical protein
VSDQGAALVIIDFEVFLHIDPVSQFRLQLFQNSMFDLVQPIPLVIVTSPDFAGSEAPDPDRCP